MCVRTCASVVLCVYIHDICTLTSSVVFLALSPKIGPALNRIAGRPSHSKNLLKPGKAEMCLKSVVWGTKEEEKPPVHSWRKKRRKGQHETTGKKKKRKARSRTHTKQVEKRRCLDEERKKPLFPLEIVSVIAYLFIVFVRFFHSGLSSSCSSIAVCCPLGDAFKSKFGVFIIRRWRTLVKFDLVISMEKKRNREGRLAGDQ